MVIGVWIGVVGCLRGLKLVSIELYFVGENGMSNVDYGLIAVIAFASSFFGAFGKELADFFIEYFRSLRKRKLHLRLRGSGK